MRDEFFLSKETRPLATDENRTGSAPSKTSSAHVAFTKANLRSDCLVLLVHPAHHYSVGLFVVEGDGNTPRGKRPPRSLPLYAP